MGTSLSSRTRYFGLAVAVGLIVACSTPPPPSDGHGMLTPYTVTLSKFSSAEAVTIIAAMAEEFPGYRSHDLMSRSGSVRTYQYLSTAKTYKLEEWLHVLLGRMDLDSGRDVLILVDGTKLTVERLSSRASQPLAPRDRSRFR